MSLLISCLNIFIPIEYYTLPLQLLLVAIADVNVFVTFHLFLIQEFFYAMCDKLFVVHTYIWIFILHIWTNTCMKKQIKIRALNGTNTRNRSSRRRTIMSHTMNKTHKSVNDCITKVTYRTNFCDSIQFDVMCGINRHRKHNNLIKFSYVMN